MNKRLCVLQVTDSKPSEKHIEYFKEKQNCDFYFVTSEEGVPNAVGLCDDWVEARNMLIQLVPKKYDYYAFIDSDHELIPSSDKSPLEQILYDLEQFEPAVLTYSSEAEQTVEYSCKPFLNSTLKIINHSLIQWFFPLYDVWTPTKGTSLYMFNLQEVPFLKNVVCSHKMLCNNLSDNDTAFLKDWEQYRNAEIWRDFRDSDSFKKTKIVDRYVQPTKYIENLQAQFTEHLHPGIVQRAFVDIVESHKITPQKSVKNKDYLDFERVSKFFDLKHERFLNVSLPVAIKTKTLDNETKLLVEQELKQLSFEDFKKLNNPWPRIVKTINSKIVNDRQISINECVEIYQNIEGNKNPSLFHNSCTLDEDLSEFLKDKRVAYVGPSPGLLGTKSGAQIDSYDVVVRIQPEIESIEDYGSRTDIVQSCLNSNYGPPLIKYLKSIEKEQRPKFVTCNDQPSTNRPDGSWIFVDEAYKKPLQDLGVPLVHLRNDDDTWDRWALYWQIYPKEHMEYFGEKSFVSHTPNFNSGYGGLNYFLRYPIKELAVFGVDFYKTALPQNNEQKYSKAYIKTYGDHGTHLGPSKYLHDQLSQIVHCKNILLKDDRFNLDKRVLDMLYNSDIDKRLDRFKKLTKFKHNIKP